MGLSTIDGGTSYSKKQNKTRVKNYEPNFLGKV